MEDTVERRLTALEERLGLPSAGNSTGTVEFDFASLRRKISDAGYGFVLRIPSEDLKKLNDFLSQPEYVTFAEKQRAIEFGYDLMLERAKLLEEFEKGSEILDSEQWGAVMHHEPALEAVEKELEEAAEDVHQRCVEQMELRNSFKCILRQLQAQVKEWEAMLDELEGSKSMEL
uniref:Uncharacterized protein n=1 Tax=Parascaris univalens TaxID=6257 RepID=A0A915ANU2_PARUN